MKKTTVFILALCLLCGCGSTAAETPPEAAAAPVVTEHTAPPVPTVTAEPTPTPEPTPKVLETEGTKELLRYDDPESGDYLDYWLAVPEDAVEGMPLLVFLHGDGNRAMPETLENNPLALAVEELYGGEAPFILLMPNTRLWSWTTGSIPQTLLGLIDKVASDCAVDTSRVIIAGHSRGAIGTWYYISAYPERFSAAMPISCGCDEALDYEAMSTVPVWGFSGNIGQDGTHYLPAMNTIAANINAAGGSARIDVLYGCDHAAAEAAVWTKEVFEWLLSQ